MRQPVKESVISLTHNSSCDLGMRPSRPDAESLDSPQTTILGIDWWRHDQPNGQGADQDDSPHNPSLIGLRRSRRVAIAFDLICEILDSVKPMTVAISRSLSSS